MAKANATKTLETGTVTLGEIEVSFRKYESRARGTAVKYSDRKGGGSTVITHYVETGEVWPHGADKPKVLNATKKMTAEQRGLAAIAKMFATAQSA